VSFRDTLYGDFITEVSGLIADAFDHSLDRPDKLVKMFALMARIRLVASHPVVEAADACCTSIVDLYAKPNRGVDALQTSIRSGEMGFVLNFSEWPQRAQKFAVL
jgi:hypothetical protein